MPGGHGATITTEPWDESIKRHGLTRKGETLADDLGRLQIRHPREPGKIRDEIQHRATTRKERGEEIEVLGTGTVRVVISLSGDYTKTDRDCALKVPYNPRGQTATEKKIWTSANGRQAALLCPLADWSDKELWVSMLQAYQPPHSKAITQSEKRQMRNGLLNVGIKPTDVERRNLGILNDRIVVVDYGEVRYMKDKR